MELKAEGGEKGDDPKHFMAIAANYAAVLADVATTVAHELVHCFIGFLAGDGTVQTPTQIVPPGVEKMIPKDPRKPRKATGESGWTWESRAFGGCGSLRVWKDDSNKPGSSPEMPKAQLWVKDEGRDKEGPVDPGAVRAMVNRSTLADTSYISRLL